MNALSSRILKQEKLIWKYRLLVTEHVLIKERLEQELDDAFSSYDTGDHTLPFTLDASIQQRRE